jgi:hypothetical protein
VAEYAATLELNSLARAGLVFIFTQYAVNDNSRQAQNKSPFRWLRLADANASRSAFLTTRYRANPPQFEVGYGWKLELTLCRFRRRRISRTPRAPSASRPNPPKAAMEGSGTAAISPAVMSELAKLYAP